ncbi:hypothetical protein E2C01_045387 [Portunus trituberculatus]|uniref:Uncharacterized protein n=1 Tax=Portunus trituberculatus TaxID=210409 RepID=A0A5B7G1X9_PORTR|nr:hypothetical protein [Portunus trituberculatus]
MCGSRSSCCQCGIQGQGSLPTPPGYTTPAAVLSAVAGTDSPPFSPTLTILSPPVSLSSSASHLAPHSPDAQS